MTVTTEDVRSLLQSEDPAAVDETAAVRWTRRSLLRLPLDLITCLAMLVALAVA